MTGRRRGLPRWLATVIGGVVALGVIWLLWLAVTHFLPDSTSKSSLGFIPIAAALGGGLIGTTLRDRRLGGSANRRAIEKSLRTGVVPPDAESRFWIPALVLYRRAYWAYQWIGAATLVLLAIATVVLAVTGHLDVIGTVAIGFLALLAAVAIPVGRRRHPRVKRMMSELRDRSEGEHT